MFFLSSHRSTLDRLVDSQRFSVSHDFGRLPHNRRLVASSASQDFFLCGSLDS